MPGWQVPLPSQKRGEMVVSPLQAREAHWVVGDHRRQAPWPSQVPSWPQVVRDEAAHWLSGSEPAAK